MNAASDVDFPKRLLETIADGDGDEHEIALLKVWAMSPQMAPLPADLRRSAYMIAEDARPGRLRRIVARLVDPDVSTRPALGIRGQSRTDVMIYESDGTRVEIEIQRPSPRTFTTAGYVSGDRDWHHASLFDATDSHFDAVIDEFGTFAFAGSGSPRVIVVRGHGDELLIEFAEVADVGP